MNTAAASEAPSTPAWSLAAGAPPRLAAGSIRERDRDGLRPGAPRNSAPWETRPAPELLALRTQVMRQMAHWSAAVDRLADRTAFAAPSSWEALESYLGVALRGSLDDAVARLRAQASSVRSELVAARTFAEFEAVRRRLVDFRKRYLQAETLVTFYAHAVSSRTSPQISALLRACDAIAVAAMTPVLSAGGLPTPPVLVYVDKGLGASILRAGLRLWDGGTTSPVAAIKVVWHNLLRPTALCHEAGHQAAFAVGWNEQLAHTLAGVDRVVGEEWAGWASEIAADAVAFVTTGYGAVAALHDVLAGEETPVFLGVPGDVHPSSWLRVLLGVAMCRHSFGSGPWDDLGDAWVSAHALRRAPLGVRPLLERSRELLPEIASLVLRTRYPCFAGRNLTEIVDPEHVRPHSLTEWQEQVGPALWTSPRWLVEEPLRLLALSSYLIATDPARSSELVTQLQDWMTSLGQLHI